MWSVVRNTGCKVIVNCQLKISKWRYGGTREAWECDADWVWRWLTFYPIFTVRSLFSIAFRKYVIDNDHPSFDSVMKSADWHYSDMCACRCYIALAHAASNLSCASLVGLPGTGKTETVKDVAKCLGKFIVVFGCSHQIGVIGMERIFKGASA